MNSDKNLLLHRLAIRLTVILVLFVSTAWADEQAADVETEGPAAALAFEKSFREKDRRKSKPVRFEDCQNITPLTTEMWSTEHVLCDFEVNRTPEQIGVIVILKTEYCCKGTRLCAVTTAVMEKKGSPLVGQFRIYAAWIKNNPDQKGDDWKEWHQKMIDEYEFEQGPGARVVAIVPKESGDPMISKSNATKLGFSRKTFEKNKGYAPKFDQFLKSAIQSALLPTAISQTSD